MGNRIYVASSWRNEHQQFVVAKLREAEFEVYDFKNPAPGERGFHWSDIDPDWKNWTPAQFKTALDHPIAVQGYGRDRRAMEWADQCVLTLPSGISSHLEAGWMAGAGKPTCVYMPEHKEPELMYKLLQPAFDNEPVICLTIQEVITYLRNSDKED